jgi:Putative adhesin
VTTPTPTQATAPLSEPGQPGWLVPARVFGLLLALVAIGFGALAVSAQFATTEGARTETFSDPVTRLEVKSRAGDVTIRFDPAPADGKTVVKTVRRFSFGSPRVTSTITGGTLRLDQSCDRHWWLPGTCAVDVDLSTPVGIPVVVTTETGNVAVDGATAAVRISVDTGDISVLDSAAGTVRADSTTGDIRLQFRTPPQTVSARADTGDLRVQVPLDAEGYRVQARTEVGNLRVDARLRNGQSTRTLDVLTTTGDITVSSG